MHIQKITNSIDIERTYRFPYRLLRKPLQIELGRPESRLKIPQMGLFSAHHAAHGHFPEYGDEVFGQTTKLDDFGGAIIDQKLHVGKVEIETDTLTITLNTEQTKKEWSEVEGSLKSIFCLDIKG